MTLLLLFVCVSGVFALQLVVSTFVVIRQTKRAEQEGLRLLRLNAKPTSIAVVNGESRSAWQGLRQFRVARREFEDRAHSQCSFYLQPVDAEPLPPYSAGQYLTFQVPASQLPHTRKPAAAALTRCYSLSDAPNAASYRVTIKRALPPASDSALPPGLVSTYFLDRVREGDVIDVGAPAGRFCIDPASHVPVVLIAGGIGITPLLSMLEWCCATQPTRTVHLFYGVRNGLEHAFGARIAALDQLNKNVRVHNVYAAPVADDTASQAYEQAGYITIDLLERTLPAARYEFYVCGPSQMMESLVPAIAEWGVPLADIHFEAFGPATVRLGDAKVPLSAQASDTVFSIKFRQSNRTIAWDGRDESLLEFAERRGIVIDAGCRTGSCGSCQTVLASGDVRYANPPDFVIETGCCLPCVAVPTSSLVLEA